MYDMHNATAVWSIVLYSIGYGCETLSADGAVKMPEIVPGGCCNTADAPIPD
jgi:hypothetical protein